ncbi:hypothetical protein [Synechococcus sp. PCC 7336]|uniref:hypothetical protein n=1 Tax=Synechococcus sp. PCC 7336 TaxID=195250 RepID=UPI0012EA52F7|nr:hypothetical protein [Synechococcus sp. PCC 7336]
MILAAYATITKYEALTAGSAEEGSSGFFAAEAGLNLRASNIRALFDDFNTPSGTSPDISDGSYPCRNGNTGTGDFQCDTYSFQDYSVDTGLAFIEFTNVTIPDGDPFEGLDAQEFRYMSSATSYRLDANRPQAILGMIFRSRRVPMFQFMAFYDKDLEITPGSDMTLNGPIHSNGNVFLNAQGGDTLTLLGQLTIGHYNGAASNFYRGRKHNFNCNNNSVAIATNSSGTTTATLACNSHTPFTQTDLEAWGDRIQLGLEELDIPDAETFEVGAGNPYWDLADLRLVLDLNGATPTIEVRNPSGTVNTVLSNLLDGGACDAAAMHADETFFNLRENTAIEMLDIDMVELLNCIDDNTGSFGFSLDDNTQNGLVFYLSVLGPDSDTANNYGTRLLNGDTLLSTNAGAPTPEGLTVVTDQAVYIQGDYNSPALANDWIPAAVISDSLNVLSNAWSDFDNDGDGFNDSGTGLACTASNDANCPWEERLATSTTIHTAILTGTTSTGGGEGGLNTGTYNGGMHNLPRFHEVWDSNSNTIETDATLTLLTSFVSLKQPDHVDGTWRQTQGSLWYYQQPIRNWSFDTRFRDPTQLPPMTPSVAYLRQELFVRDFDR